MSKDFLVNRLRTDRIIAKNSDPSISPKLVVYSDDDALNFDGGINASLLQNKAGSDAFLFISGTIDGKKDNVANSVSVFGGDVVISGTLYAEKQIIEVDVSQTGSLSVSGSIVHTDGINIGDAEDGTYDDGLFTDFTPSTPLGVAIDRFNEVLRALAPSFAPDLSNFSTNTVGLSSTLGKLSFGNTNAIAGYENVIATGGYSQLDINSIYEELPEISGNYKLGIYDGTNTLEGVLNDDTLVNQYENGVVNYPENSFNDGEKGQLNLYLNDTLIHSINLEDASIGQGDSGSGSGIELNSNGSGFFELSIATPGKFASQDTFPTFAHRTGKFRVHPLDQVNGHNFVQVKHEISGQGPKITGTIQWVNDTNSDPLTLVASSITPNLTGSKHISGIEYFTGGDINYSLSADNVYKNVYSTNPVTYSTTNVITYQSDTIPDITSPNFENETLVLQKTSSISLPSSNRMLNDTVTIQSTIPHPIKTNLFVNDSVNGFLIDNSTSLSNDLLEDFRDESFRLIAANYNAQTEVATNSWDSTQQIISSNSPYNTGLLQFNDKLMSTRNASIPLSANFNSFTNGPTNNPDYSVSGGNISGGTKTYYRKILNNSSANIDNFSYTLSGDASLIDSSSTIGSSNKNFKLYFKIPDSAGSDQTGWMDAYSEFTYDNILDDDGCRIGSLNTSITSSPKTNYVSFGTKKVAQGEFIVMKLEANSTWTGDLDLISFNLDVVGNVINAPQVNNINFNQSGSTRKLSFGNSLDYPPYDSVLGIASTPATDVNNIYTQGTNRIGILNGNTDITGTINSTTSASGNNYQQHAWGAGKANEGTLVLEVNGADLEIFDLTTNNTSTITSLTISGSGFTDITPFSPGRDSSGLPDYNTLWRKANYVIKAADQVPGWNYAKIKHVYNDGTSSQTFQYTDWVNDSNSVQTSIVSNNFVNPVQGSSGTNYLSGVQYYVSNPLGGLQTVVANAYKYTYNSASNAIRFANLTGVSVNSISTTGSGVVNSNTNSSTSSLPSLDTSVTSAYDNNINIDATFTYNITNYLPSSTNVVSMAIVVDNVSSNNLYPPKPFVYNVSDTETATVENFSAESYRLIDSTFTAQSDVTSGAWNSQIHLNDVTNSGHNTGLMVYDNELVVPDYDFTAGGLSSNPDYTQGISGTRTFYRKFQNNSGASQTNFQVLIRGQNNPIISDKLGGINDIKVSLKLPKGLNETGFMNLAKPFFTGQTADDDGCYVGTLNQTIVSSGTGTPNSVTFGTTFISPNEFIVLKIETDPAMTASIDRIEIIWS